MQLHELQNRSVLILGFGREGLSTYKYLRHHFPEKALGIADSRLVEEHTPDVREIFAKDKHLTLYLGADYLKACKEYEIIIRIPSLPLDNAHLVEAAAHRSIITSSTKLFFANTTGEIIGVTGSKGKSTTSTLIAQCLQAGGLSAHLIGNIGKPVLDYLVQEQPGQIYVYELSSYQLEDLDLAPHIGVITSFFPDHLDHHGSLEKYFDAKMQMPRLMGPEDLCIFNAANEKLSTAMQPLVCKKLPFNDGMHSKIDGDFLTFQDERIVPVDAVHILGKHNLENILGVISAVKQYDISNAIIEETLRDFHGLEHRLELVGTFHGITFYNDAISTTPESTIAAIDALQQPIGSIILGGFDRGYNFEQLAELILKKSIPNVLLLPDSGTKIWETIQSKTSTPPHHVFVSNMEQTVEAAYNVTPAGTICLLSCASPSYSIFKNFEEKGRLFKDAVRSRN